MVEKFKAVLSLSLIQPEDNDSSGGMSSSTGMTDIQENTCSSIDDIRRRVQDLVEEINDSRTSDQKVMDGFEEKLMKKVPEMCQQMKELMYSVYEENSNKMEGKLQELFEVLERCTKLNKELVEANQALSGLREALAVSQTPEP
ncbi:synaptonemal complex central element protein 2 isoform X2 [Sparus aurata]|uniref:synaptonemal complex central element protein 2 isoform X2 n=1 Tax=Sparus aurata TaxID=8175 RepID=UPI0011C15E0E|nr:uncharacterized protein LOC115592029 isoform X2 [Sparus aurata]